jgi:hypothetical protein
MNENNTAPQTPSEPTKPFLIPGDKDGEMKQILTAVFAGPRRSRSCL